MKNEIPVSFIIAFIMFGISLGAIISFAWYNQDKLNRNPPETFCISKGFDGSLPKDDSSVFQYSQTLHNTTYAHCCSLKLTNNNETIKTECKWVEMR